MQEGGTLDYGGQDVFPALHHLFWSRFGEYLVCVSTEWMATAATGQLQQGQCLPFKFLRCAH